MKTVKTVTINPECKSFDRKNFICTHIVNITYTDDTQHNLVMSATNIMNFYSQYINDSLRFHFSLYNDKLLLDILSELYSLGIKKISVILPKEGKLEVALRDRLEKASHRAFKRKFF